MVSSIAGEPVRVEDLLICTFVRNQAEYCHKQRDHSVSFYRCESKPDYITAVLFCPNYFCLKAVTSFVEPNIRIVVRKFWTQGPHVQEKMFAGYVINDIYFSVMCH